MLGNPTSTASFTAVIKKLPFCHIVPMRVVLHNIERRDNGLIELTVAFGGEPPKQYSAAYDGSHDNYKFGSTDDELFFALSELAHKRFGNCVVYQMELMGILSSSFAEKSRWLAV